MIMGTDKEKELDERAFVKGAYQALIDRGVITEDMLMPSTVTDEMLDAFEQKYDVKMPSLLRVYLQTYCHNIDGLNAPVPDDDLIMQDEDTMRQIMHMSIDEINELDEEEQPYVDLCWCEMFPIPQEDPLGVFREAMEGFAATADCMDEDGLSAEDVKQFIPFADWMGAGPLCIDTSIREDGITCEDGDTWQVCWFDHEEFHWREQGVEYVNDEGIVVGDKKLADFRCFLRLYFYGIYDKDYESRMEEEGEEMPDKSEWCSVRE